MRDRLAFVRRNDHDLSVGRIEPVFAGAAARPGPRRRTRIPTAGQKETRPPPRPRRSAGSSRASPPKERPCSTTGPTGRSRPRRIPDRRRLADQEPKRRSDTERSATAPSRTRHVEPKAAQCLLSSGSRRAPRFARALRKAKDSRRRRDQQVGPETRARSRQSGGRRSRRDPVHEERRLRLDRHSPSDGPDAAESMDATARTSGIASEITILPKSRLAERHRGDRDKSTSQ